MIRFRTSFVALFAAAVIALGLLVSPYVDTPALAQATQQVLLGGYTWTDGTAPATVTSGTAHRALLTTEGIQLVTNDHPKRVNCRLTTAATTSTAITGCTAPGASLALFITNISVYGGVATGATAAASVQYGTGGTCGSGTTIVYDCQHAATAGCEVQYLVPKKAAANSELCVVDATVGTKFVSISGYIGPS